MLYTFHNNELQKRKNDDILKFYWTSNYMCHTFLAYDFHNLQRQFMGFHELILTLSSFISCDNISQLFCPKYKMLLKPLHIFLFLGVLKKVFYRKL